jgi:hypothetical protein
VGEEVTLPASYHDREKPVECWLEELVMPLRDHFRPPLDLITSWEGFHGGWPMVIVQQLRKQLPPGYVAEPRVHSRSQVEIDVAAFEKDEAPMSSAMTERSGGVLTAVWARAEPSVAVETTLPVYARSRSGSSMRGAGRIWSRPSRLSVRRTRIARNIEMSLSPNVRRCFRRAWRSASSTW